MCIFTNKGFLSIVEDRDDPERLLVRARYEGDIERHFGGEVEVREEARVLLLLLFSLFGGGFLRRRRRLVLDEGALGLQAVVVENGGHAGVLPAPEEQPGRG